MSRMIKLFGVLVVVLMFVSLNSAPGQFSENVGADQLSRVNDNQQLDSYWLDQNMWTEYGYRPHTLSKTTPWSTLPSYSGTTGQSAYAYGMDLPTGPATNQYEKKDVQLTKYGTWH